MINIKIFSSIFYLEIDAECTENVLPELNLFISNDITHVKEILAIKQNRTMIGFNEAHSLENSKCIFYQPGIYDSSFEEFNDRAYLINTLVHLQIFYHSLWLVKDNAVHSELAYIIYDDGKQIGIHSNLWTSFYTDAQGKLENVTFTVDEIKSAISLYPIILEINKKNTTIPNLSVKLSSKSSRISRALFFIQ